MAGVERRLGVAASGAGLFGSLALFGSREEAADRDTGGEEGRLVRAPIQVGALRRHADGRQGPDQLLLESSRLGGTGDCAHLVGVVAVVYRVEAGLLSSPPGWPDRVRDARGASRPRGDLQQCRRTEPCR